MLINFGFISQGKSQVRSDSSIRSTSTLWLDKTFDQWDFRGRIYEKKTAISTRNAACHFDPDGDIDYFEGFKKVVLAIEKLISSGNTRYILRISKIGHDE